MLCPNCTAAKFSVTQITTPESAGTVSTVKVVAQTSTGSTATGYRGTIHFTSTDGQAALPANYTFVTADDGVHTFTNAVTLKTAGTQSVTVTDTSNSTITGSQTGIVVAPVGASTLVVSSISSPRTAGAASSVTVAAHDTYGNTATGYTGTIHFTSTDGQAVLPANYTFTTGDAGVHTFSNGVTLKTVGTQSVTATDTVTSTIVGSETGLQINPAAAATFSVSGIASPTTAGASTSPVVRALDAYGNTATGYLGTARFSSSDSQATLPANYTFVSGDAGAHTFTNGVVLKTAATQSVTTTDTVTSTITGTQGGIHVNPAAAATLSVSGIASPAAAGSSQTATVKAVDAYGNQATGYLGTIHFTSTDAQASLPPNYTFTAGDTGSHVFSGGITLKTAGTQSATATDTVTSTINGSQTGIQVNPGTAASFTVHGFPSPSTAGVAGTVSMEARDAYANVVTTYSAVANISSSDAQASSTTCTFASGTCSTSFTLKTAGTQSISAIAGSVSGSQTSISVVAASAASLSLSGIASPITAGTAGSLTVLAKDAFGNNATTYLGTAHFTSSDVQSGLPANYTFTSGDGGLHTFTNGVTLKTAGTQSVTATDTITTTINGSQTGIQVNPGTAALFTVHGFLSPSTAGVAGTVSLEARDAYSNIVTSYASTATISSSDAQAISTTCPFASGTCSTSFTLKTAGAQSISATAGAISGSQTGISVVAASAASLSLSGIASPITAGTAGSLTVLAKDAFGNNATTYAGSVRFTSSDPQATVPANYTFTSGDAGVHTFTSGVTLRTSGAQSVSAADISSGSVAGLQGGISVSPAAAASLTETGTPSATAGVATQAKVSLLDPYGNIATGYIGTVHFTSSDALATMPSDRTFAPADAGVATVTGLTFRTAGTQSLTATDTQTSSLSGIESGIAVAAGTASTLTVAGFPSPTSAGAAGAFSATAHDTWNNVATSYRGTVSFASSDSAAVLPAAYSFTSTDAGTRAFVATLKTVGAQSITATDGTLTSSQTGISVIPGSAVVLVLSGVTNPVSVGTWSPATVQAKDAYGNRATGYLGTVAFASSDAQATFASPYAFTSGDAGLHTFASAVSFTTYGTQSLTATDTATSSITGTLSGISVYDGIPPTWPAGSTLTATATSTSTAHLSWTAATDNVGVTAYRVYMNGSINQTVTGLAADVSGLSVGVPASLQIQAGDAAGNWSTSGPTATVTTVPPDPKLIAPPLDTTVVTSMGNATAFLYTGPNAIQTGVTAGAITNTRASVLRGLVRDRNSQPLSAVKISVLNHPEYGLTWSRADGTYDFALNGGDVTTLQFSRSDLLAVQRQVTPKWQDFAPLADVVMVPYDSLSTIVTSGSMSVQVARGSLSTDNIGSRQATVIVPPGTTAQMVFADNSTQSMSTLHVRATELTVGADGPRTMPGPLPPTSQYTYAVAFTADEAVAAGASHVQFSQPVYGYLENFLGWPVGTTVPNGSYDAPTARWLPESNGVVLQVLSVSGGAAVVDSTGSGQPDNAARLSALGISNSELTQLASLYQAGQSLWRVPMLHFSYEDWNAGPGVPSVPPQSYPAAPPPQPPFCAASGCTIGVYQQEVGERIPIVGAPYELNYRSDWVSGRRAAYRMDLTLPSAGSASVPQNVELCLPTQSPECQPAAAGATIPLYTSLTVSVGGTITSISSYGSPPSQPVHFEWNGQDAYGRTMQGQQTATITTCIIYPAVWYSTPDANVASFAQPSLTGVLLSVRWVDPQSAVFNTCNSVTTKLGTWDRKAEGLGGWALSSHHALDVPNKTVYRGDGAIQRVDDLNRYVANVYAGSGTGGLAVDGVPATSLSVGQLEGLAVGSDGSLYFSGSNLYDIIGKVTPDGLYHRFAGVVSGSGSDADGVLATQAHLYLVQGLTFGPDGSAYYAETGGPMRIRRITPDGYVHTVAGGFAGSGCTADGAVAVGAKLNLTSATALAIGQDGTVYFPEGGTNRIRKVGPDGILRTAAGSDPTNCSGYYGLFGGDGGPATSAHLYVPGGVAIAPDGSLLIADTGNNRVRRVTPDGIINTVAGSNWNCWAGEGSSYPACGDGGPATAAGFSCGQNGTNCGVSGISVSPDGAVFVADTNNHVVRRFTIGGTIDLVGGTQFGSCSGADCPARQLHMGYTTAMAGGIAGDAFVSDQENKIYRITSAQIAQQIGLNNITVSSPDASEVYVFDLYGRHLKTLDALTNAQAQLFGYDSAGRLVTITDRDNNVTTIQRDGQGNPYGIVGPYGQTTNLGLDSNGFLHTVTNPNSEMLQLLYKPVVSGDPHTGGLLSQYIDARGGSASYQYDNDGFLTQNTEPDGSYHTYTRSPLPGSGALPTSVPGSVTRTSALGRTEVFQLTASATGDTQTVSVRGADGLSTTQTRSADHTGSVSTPDGMVVTTQETADPRFGIQAGYTSSTVTKTPSALTRTETHSRSAALSNPQDPLSLTSLIESVTVNGNTSSSSYNASTRRMTMTSPAGRVTTMDYDALGHVVAISPPGVQSMQLHYDAHGRNDTITQGSRVTTLAYDSSGFLHSILDPASHSTVFGYDLAGRPTSETLPDTNLIGMGYDQNGNVTSVTPPSRPAHSFGFTAADLESDYTPPGGSQYNTHTTYNLDQQVSNVSRPDGDYITPTYDSTIGRLTALATSRGSNGYGYSSTTGQLTSITTFDGIGLTYGYDGSLLRDITWSGPISGNVHKTYDSTFRLSSESVTGGQTINFGYDNDNLLTSAGAMTITRDPATGFVTGTALGAISETRTYDAYGAEQHYTVSANGNTLYDVDYGTRDALGRIVNKTETVQGATHVYGYTYDANGRLTDVSTDGNATSHYEYDANGNRLVGPGLSASPVYDNQDRLLSYGTCTYTYKNDGSLQTKTCPDGTTTYDYDAFGNLRGVTLPNGTVITYLIDGQNRRVGKKVNGTLVESFLYEGDLHRVGWYDGTGALKAQFSFGERLQVPEYMSKAGQNYRLVYDQVGSVREVVAPDGSVSERIDYDEFGNILTDSAPGFQPFVLAGGLRDIDTGLIRFGIRDYDSTTGRWTAKDPLRFGAGDAVLYAYVNSDPINSIDPSGLDGTGAVIGACFGGVIAATAACAVTGPGFIICEPIGIIGGIVLGAGIGHYAENALQMAKGGKQNIDNEYTREAVKHQDPCRWLQQEYDKARAAGDSVAQQKIIKAQKALGCRRHG